MIHPLVVQTEADVGRHYDDLDAFYRDVWGEHVHHGYWERKDARAEDATIALIDLVASRAALLPGQRVCDAGCGYGATAFHLASRYQVITTGITLSARQFSYAQEHYATNACRFLLGDWLDNSLAPESFDVVTAIECLSHMTDKVRFFHEAHRVLMPGGRLVICAWLAGQHTTPRDVRRLLEPICREGRLPSMLDATEVKRFAEDSGLEMLEVELLTPRVRRTWSICIRRVVGRIVSNQRYRRYLFDTRSPDRAFLKSICRIMIAYRTGAMEYGLFVARKPSRG